MCFRLRVDSDLPDTLESDKKKIQQILLNLLLNAQKFTTKGFIKLEVKKSTMLQQSAKIPSCLFKVSDRGFGIEPERIEKIFNFFEDNRSPELGR